ncbi:FkbM family methyltransferase [Blastopirellula marina]|uniref:FkbM family methyltransferase n=1 Tax=Blastopirellula marina TaxID=124 RepID=UPI001375DA2E|nr:FkbM family methyltransferase [Blastopirellula marina]
MPITELLFRLIREGDSVIDAGANMGYMTCVMAYLAGTTGRVDAFEPHPALAQRLRKNVGLLRQCRPDATSVNIHEEGLSTCDGQAFLESGPDFAKNQGTSQLTLQQSDSNGVQVTVRTLDQAIGSREIAVLKLDVEGHETAVLLGAENALRRKAIRHVIFENHDGPNSRPVSILSDYGYDVVEIGWTISRLIFGGAGSARLSKRFEAPNYLATIDLKSVRATADQESGWRCLRSGVHRTGSLRNGLVAGI